MASFTEEDDEEWEYWINASDEEVECEEARIDSELRALHRKLDAMTVQQQVAHHRHFLLQDLLKNRQRLRDPKLNTIECISQMWRDSIKRCQVRLCKLRTWRSTGIYPGEA